jgi:cathepsin B
MKKYKSVSNSLVELDDVESIKIEILANGPVETGFTVYADFFDYNGGIYQHTSGSAEGGHAVKILGWGTENNVDYWIVANSWGKYWGENGYFRIK